MKSPGLIKGVIRSDERGSLFFNNAFNASDIKRIYAIESINCEFVRGWQGHKIEQRWFSIIMGTYKILVAKIEDLENLADEAVEAEKFILSSPLDILNVPGGYATAIRMLQPQSRLLVLADYALNEIKDEYRFQFTNII